jgi:hypothetical protein
VLALREGGWLTFGWDGVDTDYDLEFLARTMERELAHIPQMKAA